MNKYFCFGMFVLVFISFYSYESLSVDLVTCNTAIFCGNVERDCSYIRDSFCPENYGDWSGCIANNYGGKCYICDSDCGNCGGNIAIDVPNSNAGSQITINVNAYGYSTNNGERYKFILLNENLANSGAIEILSCNNNICSYNFMKNSPNLHCKTYQYHTDFFRKVNGDNDFTFIGGVSDSGRTSPYILLNEMDDNRNINVYAYCNGDAHVDVRVINYYLEKLEEDSYIKINSRGDQCNNQNCNIIGTSSQRQGDYFTFRLNDANLRNGHYKLTGTTITGTLREVREGDVVERVIEGDYPESSSSIEFDIIDRRVGVGGVYQGSKILNIVLAKIKVWL